MDKIAAHLRTMQLYAHACHNVVSGPHFLDYHDYLGELYPVYEGLYDDVVERIIGLGNPINIAKITADAAKAFQAENFALQAPDFMFLTILKHEKDLCSLIEKEYKAGSIGTQQFLGDICDKSEMRQYKLKQLLKAAKG